MVCRSTPGNSALTTHARLASGLHDVQVLSLFHEIRSEIPRSDRGHANQEEVHRVLGDVMTSVAEDDRFSPARRRSMAERVSQSMERPVDARTFHAWQNIEERSVRAAAAMNTHFEAIARRHACTPSQAQARFNEMMDRGYRVGGEAPVAPEHVTFSMANLPRDEHTRHALAMLYDAGPSHLDSEGRRLQAQARVLATSTQIANGTHSTSTSAANQCPDCGQFAGPSHDCPPTRDMSADEAIQRTLRTTGNLRDGEARFAVLSDHALARVGADLADRDRGREMLRGSMERLSRSRVVGGDWVTTRGDTYASLEEANLRQFEIDYAAQIRPTETEGSTAEGSESWHVGEMLTDRADAWADTAPPLTPTDGGMGVAADWHSLYQFIGDETGRAAAGARNYVADLLTNRISCAANEDGTRTWTNADGFSDTDPRMTVMATFLSEHEGDGIARCEGCGQFAGSDHACPQTQATAPEATTGSPAAALADLRYALADTLYDDTEGTARQDALLGQFLAAYISDADTRDLTAAALRRGITYNSIGGHYDTVEGRSYDTEEEIVAERFTAAWEAGARPCPSCQYLHVEGGCGPNSYRIVAPEMPAIDGPRIEGLPRVRNHLNDLAQDSNRPNYLTATVAATIQEATGMSDDEVVVLLDDLYGQVAPADDSWDHPGFMSGHQTFHPTRQQAAFETFAERWQSGHRRCPGCGRFAAPDHRCPNRVAAPTSAAAPTATSAASETAPPPPVTAAAPTRQRTPLRSYGYDAADGTRIETRTMNLSALRSEAGAGRMVEVATRISNGDQVHQITGTVMVEDQGGRIGRHRDRFSVGIVNDPQAAETNGGHANSLRCTCPAYQANYDCEHLRQTTSHLMGLLNRREAPAIPPRAVVEAVENDLRAEYNASLGAQADARAAFADAASGASYSEDMDAFQNAWEEARDHFAQGNTDLPYMRENATGGLGAREGGRSFGIEIEVDFPDDTSYTAKESVAREIYEAGLSQSPYVQGWHYIGRAGGGYTDAPDNWSVEFDRSVDGMGGRRGCEIVSPIMYDEPQTWRSLEKICEIVQRHGGQVTTRTGLHVNVGASDFDHTVENHNRLLRLGMGYEDVLIRTSHNPQSATRHRGRDYCRPMAVPADGYTSIRGAQRSVDPYSDNGSSHRAMINLDHVPAEGQPVTSSTRVEVRVFDGAVDPGRIQTNVKVALGLVNAAARGATTPDTTEAAGTHRASNMGSNGRMRRLSGEEWRADTASFRSLADTIFTREEDKRQLTYAFASSRWQAGTTQFSAAYSA